MQSFIISLLAKAVKNPDVRAFAIELALALARQLENTLVPKISGLFPLFASSLIHTLEEKVEGFHIPGLPPVGELAEGIRNIANGEVPDWDIPVVSDAVKKATGFDLTDMLNSVLGGPKH